MLCSESESFGWIIEPGYVKQIHLLLIMMIFYFSKTIKSPENDAVLDKLVKEVKGTNRTFDSADIRGKGAYLIEIGSVTFFFPYT